MTSVTDLYVARESWLHAADARVKLLMMAAGVLGLLLLQNLALYLGALVLILVMHASARIPAKRVVGVLRTILPIGALVAVLRAVFEPAGAIWIQWGWLKLTWLGMAEGGVLALRLLTMGLVVFLWLYTTPPSDLIQSLVRLRVPYAWGLTLALAFRFLPVLQGSFESIIQAQQARGLDLSAAKGFQRVRLLMPVFVAMVISGFRTSDQLANALEARALGTSAASRTTWHPLRLGPMDWLLTVLTLGLTAAGVYLWAVFGFGAHPLTFF